MPSITNNSYFFKISAFTFFLFLAKFSSAQTSENDLNFYAENPLVEFAEDSAMYPSDMFQQLVLEFDISDISSLGKLHLEVSMENGAPILLQYHWTISELTSAGLLINSHFKKSLGNFMIPETYEVHLSIENSSGLLSPTITKSLIL